MTIQLPLFTEPPKTPPWWTPTDTAIATNHERERASRLLCRRCAGWESGDGIEGLCMRRYLIYFREWQREEPNNPDPFLRREDSPPEPGCCATRAGDMCEEWTPRR